LKHLTILSFQYYRLLLVYNAAFTILVVFLFGFDTHHIDAVIFLFAKLIGFASAAGLYYYMAKESYFYFRNAGYPIWRIIVNAFVIDLLLCILIISFFLLIPHATAPAKS
jgi:archaellum biogenesis protein FlaJ (TadC family)